MKRNFLRCEKEGSWKITARCDTQRSLGGGGGDIRLGRAK